MWNSLRKTLLLLLLLYNYNSYAWTATGHALTAHIASKFITNEAKEQINGLLKTPINFPVIKDTPSILPTSTEELSVTLSNMPSAAIWADAIKSYEWVDQDLNNKLASMHFLDVLLDVESGSCNDLKESDVKKLSLEGDNIVRGIKMSIKTLSSSHVTKTQKAIALRFLLHWIGDLHQPLHICVPTIKGAKTHKYIPSKGGNLVFFKDPSSIPYEHIIGKDTSTDLKKEFCQNLHLSFDYIMGYINQVPEGLDTPTDYSPNGYTLWKENMDVYISYLDEMSRLLPKEINDDIKPDLIKWANDTRKVGCRALIKKDVITFYPNQDEASMYVVFKNRDEFVYNNRKTLMAQVNKGGQRLGRVLNAVFDSQKADPKYVQLVKEINDDTTIPVLNLGTTP